MRLYWIRIGPKYNVLDVLYDERTQAHRPGEGRREDRSRDWSNKTREPKNSKDGWQLPEAGRSKVLGPLLEPSGVWPFQHLVFGLF
jgi:hypothetical protein